MLNPLKIIAVLTTALLTGCASGPSGNSYDSPVGEWSERHETENASSKVGSFTIIDETEGTYTNPVGRVEFYQVDEQGLWKGYWINPTGSRACTEKKGDSPFWGESIFQFNENYNRYKGTWDFCGEGRKFSTEGTRRQ